VELLDLVSVVAHSGILPAAEMLDGLDARTRAVIEHRRRTATPRTRRWLIHRTLLTADVVGLSIAFVAADLLFGSRGNRDAVRLQTEMLVFFLTLPAWIVLANLHGLYGRDEERADHSTIDDVVGVFHVVTVGAWTFSLGALATGLAEPKLAKLATFWLLAVLLVTSLRALARSSTRHSLAYVQNTIIVGAGDIGQLVARKLVQHPEYGLNVVGFIDAEPKERRPDLGHLALLGGPERLEELIALLDVERVIVAFSNETERQTLELVRHVRALNIQIDIVPRLFELVGPRVDVHTVEALALVGLSPARLSPSSRLLKRSLDLSVALAMLIVTAPLLALIALRVKRDSPGPVLFRQTRLGLNMREFTVLKFRTMRVGNDTGAHRDYIKRTMTAAAPSEGNGLFKLDQGDAITPFGGLLRKLSLDELPQLLNVLRGDMSLVGPRPCIPYEVENFAPHHYERFLVPAGVTGLWQVSARASATFGEALDMDVAYARSWSLGLDLRLLGRTPVQLLRQRRATA
jgi:exopolysaccharide biosynthesis polyprenyl glycosylphosphotransferase